MLNSSGEVVCHALSAGVNETPMELKLVNHIRSLWNTDNRESGFDQNVISDAIT
jgi:hypothetical protein